LIDIAAAQGHRPFVGAIAGKQESQPINAKRQ